MQCSEVWRTQTLKQGARPVTLEDLFLDYIDRKEVAGKHGMPGERQLQNWEALRIGPPVTRIGRKPFYHIASLQAWLKSCERQMPRKMRGAK